MSSRQNSLLVAEDWKKVYQTFREADFQSYDFETLRKSMIDYLRLYYPEDFNDFIFLAANQPIDLTSKSLSYEQATWLTKRKYPLDASNGIILTDNLNPLEHLQAHKSEHYRHVLVDWFGPELLVR